MCVGAGGVGLAPDGALHAFVAATAGNFILHSPEEDDGKVGGAEGCGLYQMFY